MPWIEYEEETGEWRADVKARTWEAMGSLIASVRAAPPKNLSLVEATITRGGEGHKGGCRQCCGELWFASTDNYLYPATNQTLDQIKEYIAVFEVVAMEKLVER